MSYKQRSEEHLYHAFALGVGGYIERDFQKEPLPLSAPLALSVSGGNGTSCQLKYDFTFSDKNRERAADFRMTVEEVVTEVTATELDSGWLTTGRAELTGVDINGVVKADNVRGVLTSFHPKRPTPDAKKVEAAVSTKGSEFTNLTVNGIPVILTLDDLIDKNDTSEKLRELVNKKGKDAEGFRARNFLQKSGKKDDYICDMEGFISASHLRCSIYREIALEGSSNDVKKHCYSLDITDFGRLYIGEIIVSHGSKRLNMLRFDLGCDNCGGGTGGSVDVNGATMP